ncbi:MAG: hypothetical protein ACUVWK_01320 [Nitrososphaerales archaeon]
MVKTGPRLIRPSLTTEAKLKSLELRLKKQPPILDDYGIGISCGYINSEGHIYCVRRQIKVKVEMDSKTAVEQLAKVWGVDVIKIFDRRRNVWKYKVEAVGPRARMILEASKKCLSKEKREQYENAKKKYKK